MKSQPVKFGTKATRSTPGYTFRPDGQGEQTPTVNLTAAIEGEARSSQTRPSEQSNNRYVEGQEQSSVPPIGTPYQPPFDTRGDMTTVEGEQRVLDRANACMVAAQNAADRFRREHPECAAPVGGQLPFVPMAIPLIVPTELNAMLVWTGDRGRTRSEMVFCSVASTADPAGGTFANIACVDKNGVRIPSSSIIAFDARIAQPNPALTPIPRDPLNPLPPAPQGCAAIPARITSQADIDVWNAANPTCPPLPRFTEMCPVPSPFPTTQAEADAWTLEHPRCPVVEPQAAPKKMSWLGPAALAAAAVVAVVIVTRK